MLKKQKKKNKNKKSSNIKQLPEEELHVQLSKRTDRVIFLEYSEATSDKRQIMGELPDLCTFQGVQ